MTGFEHSLYEGLRNLADSWGLGIMAVVFIVLAAWPFRPGASESNRAAANMIFDDDEGPKKDDDDGE